MASVDGERIEAVGGGEQPPICLHHIDGPKASLERAAVDAASNAARLANASDETPSVTLPALTRKRMP